MAVIPRLLNASQVEFAQKNTSNTQFDHRRRTAVNIIARDTKFTIPCQVKWAISDAESRPEHSEAGIDEQERGYVLLRTLDLNKIGKTIKRGDLITKIEKLVVQFYVLRVEYGSHYGGDFTLQKIHFIDRTGKDG